MQFALADYHQALELDEKDSLIRGRIALIHNEYGVKEYSDKKYKVCRGFYPTALKGCRGIAFTRGVRRVGRTGMWAGGGKKFVRAVSQKP